MKLYFRNSEDKERLICEAKTKDDIWDAISNFLDEHNFKCYYQRLWEQDGRVWIDVGSYTEFFIIDGTDITGLMRSEEK